MSDESIPLLPPPTWRLHPEFVRQQWRRSVLFAVLAAGALTLVSPKIQHLVQVCRDHAVRAAANVVVPAHWSGSQGPCGRFGYTTAGTFYYRLQNAKAGDLPRFGRLELETHTRFDDTAPLTVAYAADDPSHVVTNWAIEQTWNRVVGVLPETLIFLGVAGWFAHLAVDCVRALRLARRVAPDGIALLGTLRGQTTSTWKGQLQARHYRVEVEREGKTWTVRAAFPAGSGSPLPLPGKLTLVLVPAHGAARGLVLRQDFWPLRLDDDEVERAAAVLQQLDPDAGWRVSSTSKGKRVTCRPRHRARSVTA